MEFGLNDMSYKYLLLRCLLAIRAIPVSWKFTIVDFNNNFKMRWNAIKHSQLRIINTIVCSTLFFVMHMHRCSLWLLTAGGAKGNAESKTAFISTRSSICFIEGEDYSFKAVCSSTATADGCILNVLAWFFFFLTYLRGLLWFQFSSDWRIVIKNFSFALQVWAYRVQGSCCGSIYRKFYPPSHHTTHLSPIQSHT